MVALCQSGTLWVTKSAIMARSEFNRMPRLSFMPRVSHLKPLRKIQVLYDHVYRYGTYGEASYKIRPCRIHHILKLRQTKIYFVVFSFSQLPLSLMIFGKEVSEHNFLKRSPESWAQNFGPPRQSRASLHFHVCVSSLLGFAVLRNPSHAQATDHVS